MKTASAAILLLFATLAAAQEDAPQVYTRWESFGKEEGLPSDKVFCVAVDQDRIWAGTDRGLALYEGGTWKTYTAAEGLAYDVVVSLAVDPVTRDLWAGTMGGLSQFSAGQFRTFNQFNSGLPNDVVFGVAVENQNIWVATTTGEGRYRVREGRWDVYTPENAPQHEPWGYAVDYADGKVWAALWGGGVLEFDVATEKWQAYRDPDGEMEVDLFRDDGPISVVNPSVSFREGLLWVATYFGMSSYDGQRWRGYMDHDTGLASNFVNFIKAKGKVGWACTDKGLSAVDRDTNRWVTYAPATGPMDYTGPWEARVFREGELLQKIPLEKGLANNYIQGIDFQGDEVWVATSKGLSHGSLESPSLGAR
ncbi:MAG: regulator [Candidatus Latescibacteria bacterium]|nr:regulator [Candidatus Latescibacterota bacterium]